MKRLFSFLGFYGKHDDSIKGDGNENSKLDEHLIWEKPSEFATDIVIEEFLTPDFLPESIRDYVFSNAKRLNDVIPEFIAASVVTSAAAIIGGSAVVRPKRYDTDWVVVPIIWSALVADPSRMKSPAINVGTSLIEDISSEDNKIVINDVTKEALTIKLAKNPSGMLFCRDELSGWLSGLDKESRAAERGFFISAFNGNTAHIESRVGRGDTELDATILSLIGGVQPSMITPLLKMRFEGKNNDGLFERMQLLFYSDRDLHFTDIAPDLESNQSAKDAFQRLLVFRENNTRARFILCDEGQALLNQLGSEIIEKSNNEPEAHVQALIGKYHALSAKLSLIFHLLSVHDANNVSTVIGIESVQMALKWIPLLESHYHKVMSLAVKQTKNNAAKKLLDRLKDLQDGFSKRDLERKKWSGLTTSEHCMEAIACLVKHGFLKEVVEKPHGRKKTIYLIHPDYKSS